MSILCALETTDEFKSKLNEIDNKIIYKHKKEITSKDLENIEAVIGNVSSKLLKDAKSLKWVQLDSAGCESYCKDLPKDVILTNASGAFGEAIAEYMVGCTFLIAKSFIQYLDLQKERQWNYIGKVKNISDLNVVSVGMGDIGSTYAQKMNSLGANVYGVRRTIRDTPSYIKNLYTLDNIDELLPQGDVIALSLPSTDETYHILNDKRLSLLKDDCIILNVGRGSAIDEDALLNHLKKGRFAGVCLDVTEHEPLPKNNPLWNEPRVFITPHISGRFDMSATYDTNTYSKVTNIICQNLINYLNKKPLQNIVNKSLGY